MLLRTISGKNGAEILEEKDVCQILTFAFNFWHAFLLKLSFLHFCRLLSFAIVEVLARLMTARVVEVAVAPVVFYVPRILARLVA